MWEPKSNLMHFSLTYDNGGNNFWATVCKTVRPMLSDRCLSCLYVCDIGVLWPNGWMDQDETWHAGRPRSWPHCVRWGPSSPNPKEHSPQFSAHICYDQVAVWIKMPLCMEVGLCPGDTLCWMATELPLPKKGGEPPNFRPMSIVATVAHLSYC